MTSRQPSPTVIIVPTRRIKNTGIDRALLKNKRRLDRWFGVDLRPPTVVVLKNRAQVRQFWGSKFAWTTGRFYLGVLYIVDYKHADRTKEKWYKILAHEQAHKYIGEACRGHAPKWLNEGLATCLAGQYTGAKWERAHEYFFTQAKHPEQIIYSAGSTVVTKLIAGYGQRRWLKYLQAIGNNDRPNGWKTAFRRVYGRDWDKFLYTELLARGIRPAQSKALI